MIGPVVDTAWLAEHRDEVVVADVRWYLDGRSGRAAYDGGHLPGAVFVDLDAWLSAEAGPANGRHPLPPPELFAQGMSTLGIADGTTVVAYDDSGGIIASRLVWMLRVTGHAAALLDGGLDAWVADWRPEWSDQPLDTRPVDRAPSAARESGAMAGALAFTARPWPAERLADIDAAAHPDPGVTVIDARQRERFLGGPDPVDPRTGHIPGARSLDCRGNLDEDGRLLPVEALRARFADVGIEPGGAVVSYCGSGVSACLNLVALEHAGLGTGRLYPGSWSQYSHDTSRPVATTDD
jgi:thiosulfate/3-mercaptopyruvate sulfurtransferase